MKISCKINSLFHHLLYQENLFSVLYLRVIIIPNCILSVVCLLFYFYTSWHEIREMISPIHKRNFRAFNSHSTSLVRSSSFFYLSIQYTCIVIINLLSSFTIEKKRWLPDWNIITLQRFWYVYVKAQELCSGVPTSLFFCVPSLITNHYFLEISCFFWHSGLDGGIIFHIILHYIIITSITTDVRWWRKIYKYLCFVYKRRRRAHH